MKHLFLYCLIFTFFLGSYANAQSTGQVDTTYNAYDINQEFSGFDDLIKAVVPLVNGKYLVAGKFLNIDGFPVNRIARLHNSGAVDLSFNSGGTGFDGMVHGMRELENGHFAVWGGFSHYNNQTAEKVAIINVNGGLVYGFDDLDSVYTIVYEVDEFSNGDILVAGTLVNYSPGESNDLKRYTQQGIMDTIFHQAATTNQVVSDVLIGSDDEILVAGSFQQVNGQQQYCLAKFDSLGVLDTNFIFNFEPPGYLSPLAMRVSDLHMLADSSILIATSGIGSIGGVSCSSVLKLDVNGVLDTNFIHYGYSSQTPPRVNESPQGEIIVLNKKYDANGVEDESYIIGAIGEVIFDVSGKLITFRNDEISRRNLDGTLDAEFRQNLGLFGRSKVVEPTPDGRYYLGGDFTSIDQKERFGVARMMQDGTVDPTFNFNPGLSRTFETSIFPDYKLNDIAVQQDGKVLLAGEFDVVNNLHFESLVRLNQNGEVDTNFQISPGYVHELVEVEALDNGKIMVLGQIGFPGLGNGLPYSNLVRLNSDGSLDSSFHYDYTVIYPTGVIKDFEILPSGKIAVLVNHNGYYVQPSSSELLMLNSDGSVDQNFNNSFDMVGQKNKISSDSQGNLIIGLTYLTNPVSSYGGVNVPNLFKILSDGTLSTNFTPAMDTLYDVEDFIVMPDDKIILMYKDSLIRLNVDGSRDVSFLGVSNKLFSYYVNDIEYVAATGDIIAGATGSVNNGYTPGFFRFETDYSTDCSNRDIVVEYFSDITCSNVGGIEIKPINYLGDIMYSWDNGPYALNDTLFTTTVPGPHNLSLYDTSGCSFNVAYVFSGSSNQYGVDDRIHISPSSFRPGFTSSVDIIYQNDGCVQSTGEVRLVLDSLVTYNTAWLAPDQIIGDTLIWNYNAINNDSLLYTNRIFVDVTTQAQIGDFIYLTGSMYGSSDMDSSNNAQVMIGPVINGYDPNDKSVYPVGECTPHFVDEGQKFTYTIRFQNTGNSEAINIHIDDTLSSFLDPSSVKVIASSHDMYTEFLGTNVLRFKFDSILLPDSLSNPEGSKGYVVFEVNHIDQVFDETYIENQVGIYFDFNPAVITNTVFNTIKTQDYRQDTIEMVMQNCDSVFWEGDYYTASGLYKKTYANIYGCDSTLNLDLTLFQSSEKKDTIVACNEFYWEETGQLYTNSGIYQAVYSSVNGCDSMLTLSLDIEEVNYGISIAADGAIYPTDTLPSSTYQWFDCENNFTVLTNDTAAVYMPVLDGTYAVQIFNGVCADTSDCFVVDYLTTENREYGFIELFPNPAQTHFKLMASENIESVILYDNTGKEVKSAWPNSPIYYWEVDHLSSGVYLLKVSTPSKTEILRLVKQ